MAGGGGVRFLAVGRAVGVARPGLVALQGRTLAVMVALLSLTRVLILLLCWRERERDRRERERRERERRERERSQRVQREIIWPVKASQET